MMLTPAATVGPTHSEYAGGSCPGDDGKRRSVDGSTACGVDHQGPGPHERLWGGYAPMLGDGMGLFGRAAKPAVQVRLTFKDGRRMIVPVNAGGYFMTIFDRGFATGADTSRLYPATLVALDAKGRIIASGRP